MRTILAIPLIVMSLPALAQAPAATDEEIEAAHIVCFKPENFIPIGTLGERQVRPPDPDAGRYKPEWRQCEAIDAEYEKRQLAKKAEAAAAQQRIDALIKRTPQK